MSDLGRSSMVQLIRWLLTKHGFTEDDADVIIEKLRSEMTGVTGEKVNDDEVRTALLQRLTLFITRLQLEDGTRHHIFEDRYQHNYQIILQVISQILIGFPIGIISGMLGNKLYSIITVNNENRQHAEFCWKIGNIYLQQGAFDHAIDEYGQAIRFYPGYAQAFHDRGLAHLRKGEDDLAIADFNEAIRLAPNSAEAFIMLSNRGLAYASKGDYDHAIRDYGAGIKLNPNFAGAFRGRGLAYLWRGQLHRKGEHDPATADFNEAIASLTEAIGLDPDGAQAFIDFFNRGCAYACKGDYDHAIRDYRSAIALNPNFAEAFHGLGVAYNEKKEYHRAIGKFDKAIQIKPEYALAFYNRAVACWHQGLRARATKDVNKAIKLDPSLAEAFELRGLAKRMIGDLKGAEADAAMVKRLRTPKSHPERPTPSRPF